MNEHYIITDNADWFRFFILLWLYLNSVAAIDPNLHYQKEKYDGVAMSWVWLLLMDFWDICSDSEVSTSGNKEIIHVFLDNFLLT